MAPEAVPRRTWTRGAVTPVLPEELVLWEILVRLPAKALLCCRAVCRSWRCLTSAADFLLAHHQYQPPLPLVSFRGHVRVYRNAAIDAFDIQGASDAAERRPVLRFNDSNQRQNFKVHGSCDGLLLPSLSNNRFYICNPTTRQWIALPSLTGAHVVGLYKHSSSGEYCILYWKGRRRVDVVYFILTVIFQGLNLCFQYL
jgi:hypothetical protein